MSKLGILVGLTKGGYEIDGSENVSIERTDLAFDGNGFKPKGVQVGGDVTIDKPVYVGVVDTVPIVGIFRIEVKDEKIKEELGVEKETPLFVDILTYAGGNVKIPLGYGIPSETENELRYIKDLRNMPISEIEIEKGTIDPDDIEFAIKKLNKKADKYPELVKALNGIEVNSGTLKEIRQTLENYKDDEFLSDLFELDKEWDIGKTITKEDLKNADKYVLNGAVIGVAKVFNEEGKSKYYTTVSYFPYRVDLKSKSQVAKDLNNDEELGETFKALQMFVGETPNSILKNKDEFLDRINKKLEIGVESVGLEAVKKALESEGENQYEAVKEALKTALSERNSIILTYLALNPIVDANKLLAKGTDGNFFIRNLNHSEGIPTMKYSDFKNISAHTLVTVPRIIKDVSTNKFVVQKSVRPTSIMKKDGEFIPVTKTGFQAYPVFKALHNIYEIARDVAGEVKPEEKRENAPHRSVSHIRKLLGEGFDTLKGFEALKKDLTKRDTQYIEFINYVKDKLKGFVFDTSMDDKAIANMILKVFREDKTIMEYLTLSEKFFEIARESTYAPSYDETKKQYEEALGIKIESLKDTKGLYEKAKEKFSDKKPQEIYDEVRGIRTNILVRQSLSNVAKFVSSDKERIENEVKNKNYDWDKMPSLYAYRNAERLAAVVDIGSNFYVKDSYVTMPKYLTLFTNYEKKQYKSQKEAEEVSNTQSDGIDIEVQEKTPERKMARPSR